MTGRYSALLLVASILHGLLAVAAWGNAMAAPGDTFVLGSRVESAGEVISYARPATLHSSHRGPGFGVLAQLPAEYAGGPHPSARAPSVEDRLTRPKERPYTVVYVGGKPMMHPGLRAPQPDRWGMTWQERRVALSHEQPLGDQGFGVRAGLRAQETRFGDDGPGFAETVEVPVDLYYEILPGFEASLGYALTDARFQDGTTEETRQRISLGARGHFSPTLAGSVAIGMDQARARSTISEAEREAMSLDTALSWAPTSHSVFVLNVSRSLLTAPTGEPYEMSGIGITGNFAFSELLVLSAEASYALSDYKTRPEEEMYVTGMTLNYFLSRGMSVSAAVQREDRVIAGDFTKTEAQTRVALSASLRY